MKDIAHFVKKFDEERGWSIVHDTSMLAISLVAEVGELFEHYLWNTDERIREKLLQDPQKKKLVSEELSDIFLHLITIANLHDINLAEAFKDKMKKTIEKYPVEKGKKVSRYRNM